MTAQRRVALSTGVSLNVAEAGPADGPPVVLLHGFPESHRTWRGLVPLLEDRFRLVMPDQRGFGASDRPQDVEAYRTDGLVEDVFALAEALEIDRFALVGHDWGGAIAWPAALRGDPRVERLAIVNAPHPLIFQKSLIEDEAQRAASQYITAFRQPGFERAIEAMGFDNFFDKSFGRHADVGAIPPEERQHYIDDWSRPGALAAMLNWYRGSMIEVPAPGDPADLPAWTKAPFPHVAIPTLLIWAMRDLALLPVQLDGIEELVDDLRIERIAEAGHFVPWERPEAVAAALRPFLAEAG